MPKVLEDCSFSRRRGCPGVPAHSGACGTDLRRRPALHSGGAPETPPRPPPRPRSASGTATAERWPRKGSYHWKVPVHQVFRALRHKALRPRARRTAKRIIPLETGCAECTASIRMVDCAYISISLSSQRTLPSETSDCHYGMENRKYSAEWLHTYHICLRGLESPVAGDAVSSQRQHGV